MTGFAGGCLRFAGVSGIINGLGFGAFTIPGMLSLARGRGVLYTFGNPIYGYGPFERIGIPSTVPLLAALFAVCVVQVIGGVMLLWPRRSGIVVSIVGLLLCTPFWWGFNLPLAWLNAAVILTSLVLAWAARKRASIAPTGLKGWTAK